MTERTIEVERTVTDEETLKICDYCGSSEDDRDGSMVTYEPTDNWIPDRGPGEIHFHYDCAFEGLGQLGSPPEEDEMGVFKQVSDGTVRVISAPWRLFRYPAYRHAWNIAEEYNQDEPFGEDWVAGWVVCILTWICVFFACLFIYSILPL